MTTQTNDARRRFILIDSNSGYVWGEVVHGVASGACATVDAELGVFDRTYTEHGPRAQVDEDHYLVYSAPADFPEVSDGQDDEQISAVSALPLVARVSWHVGR